MEKQILFIDPQLFKLSGPIQDDLATGKFYPYVNIAQKIHIKPLLGIHLYEQLIVQIKDQSLTEPNKQLIVELAPALSFFAVYHGAPFHWGEVVNKGITVKNSENSASISMEDLSLYRRLLKDEAQELLGLAEQYLKEHHNLYPLWRPNVQEVHRDEQDCGIWFPPEHRCPDKFRFTPL
jgi:hypothetical protein